MSTKELTKEAKILLYHLYKEYTIRLDNGMSRSEARKFDSPESIQKTLFPDWYVSDINDCMLELGRHECLSNTIASGAIYEAELTTEAITSIEGQKKETLLNVVNFIANFIP